MADALLLLGEVRMSEKSKEIKKEAGEKKQKCRICHDSEAIMNNGTCLSCFNQGY